MRSSTVKPHVAIIFWEGYLGVAPSLVNAAATLAEQGYAVDVLLRQVAGESYPPPPPLPSSVHLHRYHTRLRSERASVQRIDTLRLSSLFALSDLIRFVLFCIRRLVNTSCRLLIGVDMYGIIVAGLVVAAMRCLHWLHWGTPIYIVYWSLELYFMRDMGGAFARLIKRLDDFFSRRAARIIVQDRQRAAALVEENRLDKSRIILVPNAPRGTFDVSDPNPREFHRKFGLSPSTRVLLQAGTASEMTLTYALAASTQTWDALDYVLVIHSARQVSLQDDPYLLSVAEVGKPRTLLSLDPVPLDKLDALMRSAHIGAAFYSSTLGDNVDQIALASGKIAYYLRCGLPIVCSDNPGMRDFIEGYRCGVVVSSLDEISAALRRIDADYAQYSANALRCYAERYEFGKHFEAFMVWLRSVSVNA